VKSFFFITLYGVDNFRYLSQKLIIGVIMKLSFVALFVSLISFSAFSCETNEAQFIGQIVEVKTDSMHYCKAMFSVESISLYNEHALCPLDVSEVLENGVDFPLVNGHDCELSVGETLSGYLYTTKTGISLD
jgi:uncharacterized protein YdbL (DUF1318 family)